ncbi:MAG: Co2+/Mg2+ efflux protein ApaG [Acidobacteria bacterium]|nr:MAG: Co2+/Mg2+ efflux protein ApaG [Acidobacteriota bacterium]REK00233.1 MAG: Co2+/Mg2+ efflux protein ApaG [Acidobacteriota bacterium]
MDYIVNTDGIIVEVEPRYIEERSSPADQYFFFAYTIRITNVSQRTVQLLTRYWLITDGNGEQQEVRGDGVVGQQPVLEPGTQFEYTSFCPLSTEVGTMRGSYQLAVTRAADTAGDDDMIEAEIPSFTLAAPHALN